MNNFEEEGAIKWINVYGNYVGVVSFRNVRIMDFSRLINSSKGETYVQFFDAKLIASGEHLFFAALNAVKAFQNKMNIANSLAVETLLFASGQRQIKKAVDLFGIKPTSSQVAAVIIAKTPQNATAALENISTLISGEQDNTLLDLTEEKIGTIKEVFAISDLEFSSQLKREGLERESLIDLVIEHVALLGIQR